MRTDPGRSPRTEAPYYAGVKPVLGKFTFDFGVIAYTYPGQISSPLAFTRDLNYYEGKAGVSVEAWKDGTIGATLFYSPEYTNKQGAVWTVEGSISQVLPKLHSVTPTFSALIGYQTGDDARYKLLTTNGASDYRDRNAGLTLGFGDNFTLDLRYWDTNVSNAGNFCDLTVPCSATRALSPPPSSLTTFQVQSYFSRGRSWPLFFYALSR